MNGYAKCVVVKEGKKQNNKRMYRKILAFFRITTDCDSNLYRLVQNK